MGLQLLACLLAWPWRCRVRDMWHLHVTLVWRSAHAWVCKEGFVACDVGCDWQQSGARVEWVRRVTLVQHWRIFRLSFTSLLTQRIV